MNMDPFGDHPGYYAEVWVYQLTPENEKLDNTVINGWKILIYPVSPPPQTTKTPKANATNTSS
jgi:hypothetical protein